MKSRPSVSLARAPQVSYPVASSGFWYFHSPDVPGIKQMGPFNTPRPIQNAISKTTFSKSFLYENCCIFNQISLKFVHQVPIKNKATLVSKMARCQRGNKPLSQPRLASQPNTENQVNMYTGDPLHNLTELYTTQQHTTELHTAQRLGGVLARLCASPVWVTLFTT